jgi:hypothetical protein
MARDMFRELTAPGAPDSPGLTSFGLETLTACDRADECAQLFVTSNAENVTMVAHILRVRNLTVVVVLQAQGAEGVSWLTEEMPYYVSLVMDKVPPG